MLVGVLSVMCLRAVETVDHLAARSRWTVVFWVCGVSWAMPRSVCEMLHVWRGVKVQKEWRRRGALVQLQHSILWTLWKERIIAILKAERNLLLRFGFLSQASFSFGYMRCIRVR